MYMTVSRGWTSSISVDIHNFILRMVNVVNRKVRGVIVNMLMGVSMISGFSAKNFYGRSLGMAHVNKRRPVVAHFKKRKGLRIKQI